MLRALLLLVGLGVLSARAKVTVYSDVSSDRLYTLQWSTEAYDSMNDACWDWNWVSSPFCYLSDCAVLTTDPMSSPVMQRLPVFIL